LFGRRQLPIADALVQAPGLLARLYVEFRTQCVAAGLVLDQGRAALAAQRQQAHQRPVRLFLPRHLCDPSPGDLARTFQLAPALILMCQCLQSG
jgi:hypothetical protein